MPTNVIAAGAWTPGGPSVNRIGFGAMRPAGDDNAASDPVPVVGVLRRTVALDVDHIGAAAFHFSPLRSITHWVS
ncbi:hypothetical protein [Micromonospora sp. NPDC049274]|uniref:hypothetical protein n=1 Tax=Micromonospora sp. NPDC049274 TaxID=3154829 RepID=UPI003415DC0B